MREHKIGEIFEDRGCWYQCLESSSCRCDYCDYGELSDCHKITCTSGERSDDKEVYFKKLEKVGEPYEYFIQGMGIIIVQEYILANTNYIWGYGQDIVVMDCQNGKVAIEIKQNKEDMEEKKVRLKKEDIDFLYDKFIEITEDCVVKGYNIDNVQCEFGKLFLLIKDSDTKLNLKPFDLEAAKAGKPVCTRDGRKARIICFDMNSFNNHIIVALITEKNGTESISSYTSEGKWKETETENDLMMLSEKKEGWVNIDKGGSGKIAVSSPYSTKEEAIHNDNETTIDTIKICWEE